MPPLPTSPALEPSTRQPRKRSPRSPAERGAEAAPPVGAGTAAVGGAAGGAVAGALAAVPAITLAGAGVLTTAGALKLFDEFLERVRLRNETWVRAQAGKRGIGQQPILDVIAEENQRQVEFDRKARDRVRRDLGRIFGLSTDEQRAALRKVLDRERRYARQRSEQMAIRAIAALDRTVVKAESPTGALWRLGPTRNHTPDCVAMSGRFWPWSVLDAFHPPTHAGCLCSLHGYAASVAAGWMRPGDVQDEKVAQQRAAAARALLAEEDVPGLREALSACGLVSPEDFDQALLGFLGGGG